MSGIDNTPSAADEPERDAFLRAALRHAPDAEAAPPQAVSAAILRQARVVAARSSTTGSTSPLRRLAALWTWLARPPVTAAFASVMIAGVIGLMWWDRPIDDPAFRPSPTPATATAPASNPAASAADSNVSSQAAPAVEEPQLAEARITPPAASTSRPSPPPPKPRQERLAPVAPAAPAAPSEDTAPAPAVAAPAPPVPTVAAKAAPVEPPPQADAAAAPQAAPGTERRMAPASRAAAPAAVSSLADRQGGANTNTMASLRASIAREPQRWTWQRDGGPAQAMNDTVSAWVAALDAAAGARWAEAPAQAVETTAGLELRLLLDGRLRHLLNLERERVRWQSTGGISFSLEATLPPTTLRMLEQTAP